MAQANEHPTGLPYGQGQQLQESQSSVPLPSSAPVPATPSTQTTPGQPDFQGSLAAAAAHQSNVTPLDAPTDRPSEPVTAGAPFGPGPGPNLSMFPGPTDARIQSAVQLEPQLPALEFFASLPASTPDFRMWVREVRGMIGLAKYKAPGQDPTQLPAMPMPDPTMPAPAADGPAPTPNPTPTPPPPLTQGPVG